MSFCCKMGWIIVPTTRSWEKSSQRIYVKSLPQCLACKQHSVDDDWGCAFTVFLQQLHTSPSFIFVSPLNLSASHPYSCQQSSFTSHTLLSWGHHPAPLHAHSSPFLAHLSLTCSVSVSLCPQTQCPAHHGLFSALESMTWHLVKQKTLKSISLVLVTPHGQVGPKVIKWSELSAHSSTPACWMCTHRTYSGPKSGLIKAGHGTAVVMITKAVFFSGKIIYQLFY